ncbi:sodium:proton antiporter [Fervidicella metallireducens AeB]|uniref:Sodium:proton antiporter n=1 Tax=Fervidicella metallireducens AeB TaxID=1403537 RepID=A0A017RXS8_9CLOT|nr:Na+/H+ antiporter NhaC family protein [Fervidicella metallireducens]EYE88750.1 sodium:proton antiporter [Fervidicella metallireducens AeB]
MDVLIGMICSFILLITSIIKGVFIGYPLIICYLIFFIISYKRKYSLKEIAIMSYNGGKKSFVVLKIFVLIGIITAIWMSSGTVPGIVYYGIRLLNPKFFILYAFLISSFVSFLLGTSLGTVSTVGIALIVMAKSGNINENMVAGAIIAGAYFGDRCSPMSSSANLVSNLTETDIFNNIKNMFRTSYIPFAISVIFYAVLSYFQPLNFSGKSIDTDIVKIFTINWIVILPAVVILLASLLKINVKISMVLSIFTAIIISLYLQNYKISALISYMIMGFKLDTATPLQSIIKGGGLISMWKASLVVFVSCSLAGIFEGTDMLKNVEKLTSKSSTRKGLFKDTLLVSIMTAAFGCNQSIAVVLTNQIMGRTYTKKNIDKYELALDIENTAIVLAALIPWNIAAFVPTSTMMVDTVRYLPFAFYLYLLPLTYLIKLKSPDELKTSYPL